MDATVDATADVGPPAQTKAERTAQRILEAAVHAFFAEGFDQTSINRIASDAGVAPGTVLLHFGSKSELATTAFAMRIKQAVESATAVAPSGRPVDDVVGVARALFAFYQQHQTVAAGLLREALFTGGAAGERYRLTVEATVVAFARLVGPAVAAADVAVVAEGVLADYLIVLLRLVRGEIDDVDHAAARFRRLAETRLPG